MILASLAVLDESYLILLPPDSSNLYADVKNDDQEVSANDGRKFSKGGGDTDTSSHLHSECETYTVPALPLDSVRECLGAEIISCDSMEGVLDSKGVLGEVLNGVSSTLDVSLNIEEAVSPSESNADTDTKKINISYSCSPSIEMIRLNFSEFSSLEFRFSCPVNLTNESSVHPIRIGCTPVEEASMVWEKDAGKNDTFLDICLPILGADFCSSHSMNYYDEEENRSIYGDELLESMSLFENTSQSHNKYQSNTPSLEVAGAGFCMIADFLGFGGYEQLLVLPQVEIEDSMALSLWSSNNHKMAQCRKNLFQIILQHSFITDGTDLLLSKHLQRSASKVISHNGSLFALPKLIIDPKSDLGCHSKNPKNTNDQLPITLDSKTQTKDDQLHSERDDVSNRTAAASSSQTLPSWFEDLKETIDHRLLQEVSATRQLERSSQIQQDLVFQGRHALHQASHRLHQTPNSNESNDKNEEYHCDPEVMRLRYGTRPRATCEMNGGTSVALDLELDIILNNRSLGNDTKTSSDRSSISSSSCFGVLHDFHISCSYASSGKTSSFANHVKTDNSSIRTNSAVVPKLQVGDSITILACILLDNFEMKMKEGNDTPTLDLCIQGLWVDGSLENIQQNPCATRSRQGTSLCIVRLPFEGLLLSSSVSTSKSGMYIQNEIEFVQGHKYDQSVLAPSAIFDYRHPRSLLIDTSHGMNSLNEINMMKELVKTLNENLGTTGFLDLYCKDGDPQIKVVVFGANPQERAATVKLLLRHLPRSLRLICEYPQEKENARALLLSLKCEADALKRHRSQMPNDLNSESLTEIASLQCCTDGVASTLKRGWV